MLRAESLINDGAALVIYAVAVGVTAGGGHLSASRAGWMLLVSYGGGAAAGAGVAEPVDAAGLKPVVPWDVGVRLPPPASTHRRRERSVSARSSSACSVCRSRAS